MSLKRISAPVESFESKVQKWLSTGSDKIKVWSLTLTFRLGTDNQIILSALVQFSILNRLSNEDRSQFQLFCHDGSESEIEQGINEFVNKSNGRGIGPAFASCCYQNSESGDYKEFHAVFKQ